MQICNAKTQVITQYEDFECMMSLISSYEGSSYCHLCHVTSDVSEVCPVEQTEQTEGGRNKNLTFWTTPASAKAMTELLPLQQHPDIRVNTELL